MNIMDLVAGTARIFQVSPDYSEFFEIQDRSLFSYYILDEAVCRSLPAPFNKLVQPGPRTFCFNVDTAVRHIPDKTLDAQSVCLPGGAPAEPHSLYMAVDPDVVMLSFLHSRLCSWTQTKLIQDKYFQK